MVIGPTGLIVCRTDSKPAAASAFHVERAVQRSAVPEGM